MHYARYGSGGEDPRLVPLFIGYPSLVRGWDVYTWDKPGRMLTERLEQRGLRVGRLLERSEYPRGPRDRENAADSPSSIRERARGGPMKRDRLVRAADQEVLGHPHQEPRRIEVGMEPPDELKNTISRRRPRRRRV